MTKEKNDMTNGQSFKKGDIVVFKAEHLHISEEIIKDDILTVYDVSKDGNKVWVRHPAVGKVDASELDMYLPYDRRAAFLTRLQSLLKEFSASISADAEGSYCGDDIKSVSVIINIDNECLEYDMTDCDAEINADTIMDFDKE